MSRVPRRYETDADYARRTPVHVVWEITLACNLKCSHCGSRAGRKRPDELSTAECLDLVAQLARLGTREISLIGGEAYLRNDWIDIVQAITDHGIDCSMQTGGRALTRDKIARAAAAGLKSCGVSIDGLPALHDRLRGMIGSHRQAIEVLNHLREAGIPSSVNTTINAENIPQLRELMVRIIDAGAVNWQLQLAVAMGNAADHPELLVQPFQLLELMPLLAALHEEALDHGLLLQPSNTIGYFGPYEHLWRVVDESRGHWQGCNAGHTGMGIESDGTIKGCPSLPSEDYAGGNVRHSSIEQIWRSSGALPSMQARTRDDLWGYCAGCYYADVCRAGCSWMSHVLFGRPGNNPYCHHRALDLSRRGLRERIVKVADAPGRPFDFGRFQLVRESIDGDVRTAVVDEPPAASPIDAGGGQARLPPVLELCRGCHQFVHAGTTTCPHCGADVAAQAARYAADLVEADAAVHDVLQLLGTELAADAPPGSG